jgi:hypothetical protein
MNDDDRARIEAERFDTTYKRINWRPVKPEPRHELERNKRKQYFHAGRYAQGANDVTAQVAWEIYTSRGWQ